MAGRRDSNPFDDEEVNPFAVNSVSPFPPYQCDGFVNLCMVCIRY